MSLLRVAKLHGSMVWIGMGLLFVSGCANKPPPPLEAPAAQITRRHFWGTPLSGPQTATTAAVAADEAMVVRVRLVALTQMPEGLRPVGPDVRLITAPGGAEPILPAARLLREARWSNGGSAGVFETAPRDRVAAMGSFLAAVPPETTWGVEVADSSDAAGASGMRSHRLQFILHHVSAPAGLELAIGMEAAGQQEVAVLRALEVEAGRTFVLAAPFTFGNSAVRAVAAVVHLETASRDAPEPAQVEAVAQAEAELRRSADEAGARQALAAAAAKWSGFQAALTDLSDPLRRRKGLMYLAGQTGAGVCRDVALVAEEKVLGQVTQQLTAEVSDPGTPKTAAALGWLLDRSSLLVMVQLQSASDLPPELSGVLLRQVGQPARAGTLEELLKQANSREELIGRLVAENFIHLEDSSPAARVRAYDWLSARSLAPTGYDPLGGARERRDALDKALAARGHSDTGGTP